MLYFLYRSNIICIKKLIYDNKLLCLCFISTPYRCIYLKIPETARISLFTDVNYEGEEIIINALLDKKYRQVNYQEK